MTQDHVPKLFTPLTLGGTTNQIVLNHRVVMAPLTRLRAGIKSIQPDISAIYYGQRASPGGLLIAEATDISAHAHGYYGAPGIYNNEQIETWKKVTDAVHAKNGFIFLQIWHTGRISHPLNQPNGETPISSSSTPLPPQEKKFAYTAEGKKPFVTPRGLELEEIPLIVKEYQKAAENAKIAGFDGVEIHGANGYLIEQFLSNDVNKRTDAYGGSIENRARFAIDVVEAVLKVWDSSRVGIRSSPFGISIESTMSDPKELYSHLLQRLSAYHLAYVHLIEPRGFHALNPKAPEEGVTKAFRAFYKGVLLTSSGYDRSSAIEIVEDENGAEMVAFGRDFISNPDLPERLKLNAPLTPYDMATFYQGHENGYIDYPFLDGSA